MAFLDNSGDIILDAVLTDTGRMRLARGDGSFRIAKFALGDDEVDYTLYNKEDARGSAFYDLEIMQAPILEAFTNNTSLMKSKLLTIARNNLLYLPILKLNQNGEGALNSSQAPNSFIVAADQATTNATDASPQGIGTGLAGLMLGATPANEAQAHVRIDQGLDTSDISPIRMLDADLRETEYSIEMDNRLGALFGLDGAAAQPAFIDDDNIASYRLTRDTDGNFVEDNAVTNNVGEGQGSNETIRGPRGTILKFRVGSSLNLQTSDYLFTTLGQTGQSYTVGAATVTGLGTIDTYVRVTGLTTGYRVDIPVQFVKKIS